MQAGADAGLEVDLGGVAGDDDFRFLPEAGEGHEHLLAGGVLGLVEDDEGTGEGAATHEGERCDLDDSLIEVALGFLGVEHVVDCVVERAEVGGYLFLEVSGEETERLARLDGGAGEDDAVDGALFQHVQAHGHGQVGLAGARGAEAECDIVFLYGPDVGELVGGAWGYGLAVLGADEAYRGQRIQGGVAGFVGDVHGEPEIPVRDVASVALGGFEILENLLREHGCLLGSRECDPAVASDGFQLQRLLQIRKVAPVVGEEPLEELRGVEFELEGGGFQCVAGLKRKGAVWQGFCYLRFSLLSPMTEVNR